MEASSLLMLVTGQNNTLQRTVQYGKGNSLTALSHISFQVSVSLSLSTKLLAHQLVKLKQEIQTQHLRREFSSRLKFRD